MKNPPEVIGKDALIMYVERGSALPEVLDLETSLASLPILNEWLRRAMTFKGRAEMVVVDHLKAEEARQIVAGATAFGLKDGEWSMAEWEGRDLLAALVPYTGRVFSQETLDKALRLETVEWMAECPDHGPYRAPAVCGECGQLSSRLVVSHTGINAIDKVAPRSVKEVIARYRRRGEPKLTLKPA